LPFASVVLCKCDIIFGVDQGRMVKWCLCYLCITSGNTSSCHSHSLSNKRKEKSRHYDYTVIWSLTKRKIPEELAPLEWHNLCQPSGQEVLAWPFLCKGIILTKSSSGQLAAFIRKDSREALYPTIWFALDIKRITKGNQASLLKVLLEN
jgi:hypothetical protein